MATTHDSTEIVASYRQDGETYEIDHLGICRPDQWGWFAVYRGSEQVAEFAIEESMLQSEFRPAGLPVSGSELIRLAREAVADWIPLGGIS
jgi:hypothetical protein